MRPHLIDVRSPSRPARFLVYSRLGWRAEGGGSAAIGPLLAAVAPAGGRLSVCSKPLATISCSEGKSKIAVTWKAMLHEAITYSHNENQLKAENTHKQQTRQISHNVNNYFLFGGGGIFVVLKTNLNFTNRADSEFSTTL